MFQSACVAVSAREGHLALDAAPLLLPLQAHPPRRLPVGDAPADFGMLMSRTPTWLYKLAEILFTCTFEA
jgi:hypothetical protein